MQAKTAFKTALTLTPDLADAIKIKEFRIKVIGVFNHLEFESDLTFLKKQ